MLFRHPKEPHHLAGCQPQSPPVCRQNNLYQDVCFALETQGIDLQHKHALYIISYILNIYACIYLSTVFVHICTNVKPNMHMNMCMRSPTLGAASSGAASSLPGGSEDANWQARAGFTKLMHKEGIPHQDLWVDATTTTRKTDFSKMVYGSSGCAGLLQLKPAWSSAPKASSTCAGVWQKLWQGV
jgi:hypothetical protein